MDDLYVVDGDGMGPGDPMTSDEFTRVWMFAMQEYAKMPPAGPEVGTHAEQLQVALARAMWVYTAFRERMVKHPCQLKVNGVMLGELGYDPAESAFTWRPHRDT